MHVDFKLTTWERLEIPEEHEAEARTLLESGKISDAGELMSELNLDEGTIPIEGTDEQMSSCENGDISTIEAYDEIGGELFYENGQ